MAQLFWLSGQTLVDGTGTPYALAKAYFYETGTTTAKATYSNAGLSSANANPVVADSDGRFGLIYLVAGRYKVRLETAAGVQIGTDLDPVDGVLALFQSAAAPSATYAFMRYHNTSDGNVYRRNSSNAAWINEGPVDGLGNAASVTQQLAGTATDAFCTPDSVAGLWQRGADIASAGTLSLPAAGGGVFNVTGTTTINGISSAQGGRTVKLRFAGALTLTHNATSFILKNSGNNITTAAGDTAEFINEAAADASGSNWRMFNYERASGSPLNITDNLIVSTQAECEAASVNTSFLSPGRAQYHPGVAKCRVQYDQSSGTATAQGVSYNLSSITDGAAGLCTVNMTNAMSSGFYHIAGITQRPSTNNDAVVAINTGAAPTTTSYQLATTVAAVNVDMSWVSTVAHGDQ